ncbi:hypothetical protein DDZ13_09620 [Coraliomargarita sinensis]|uniref:Uncharacterized protein n=1 Tax=Coraliomargarita sinensis TaxID=2174842 RepID=A0A317ZJ06_9BACT|nr:hypothetical protein [Coraliomargarita sinensis]PXA03888.1 hypothetical protein DDZ13_09620 [Coraliomargarita sinensis]
MEFDFLKLEERLKNLAEGEFVPTLPFKRAKKIGAEFGCSYERSSHLRRRLFLKGRVDGLEDFTPKELQGEIYRGETIASQMEGWGHYLDSLISGRSVKTSPESYLFRNEIEGILDLLCRGFSCQAAQINPYKVEWLTSDNQWLSKSADNRARAWRKFVLDYIAPSAGSIFDWSCALSRSAERTDSFSDSIFKLHELLAIEASGQVFRPTFLAKRSGAYELKIRAKEIAVAVELLESAGVWNVIPALTDISGLGTRPAVTKPIGLFFDSGFFLYASKRRGDIMKCARRAKESICDGNEEFTEKEPAKASPRDMAELDKLFFHFVVNDILRHVQDMDGVSVTHFLRPPAKRPFIVVKQGEKLFPIWISYADAGPRAFQALGRIKEFKDSTKLAINATTRKIQRKGRRISLPFDIVLKP